MKLQYLNHTQVLPWFVKESIYSIKKNNMTQTRMRPPEWMKHRTVLSHLRPHILRLIYIQNNILFAIGSNNCKSDLQVCLSPIFQYIRMIAWASISIDSASMLVKLTKTSLNYLVTIFFIINYKSKNYSSTFHVAEIVKYMNIAHPHNHSTLPK